MFNRPAVYAAPDRCPERTTTPGSCQGREGVVAAYQDLQAIRTAPIPAAPPSARQAKPGPPKRTIFDAESSEALPGRIVRKEGTPPPVGDVAADEAYDGLGSTHRLYGGDLREGLH